MILAKHRLQNAWRGLSTILLLASLLASGIPAEAQEAQPDARCDDDLIDQRLDAEIPDSWTSQRIQDGQRAANGEYPFAALVVLYFAECDGDGQITDFNSGWCGGSFVAADWVITAAHCVEWGVTECFFGLCDADGTLEIGYRIGYGSNDVTRQAHRYAAQVYPHEGSFGGSGFESSGSFRTHSGGPMPKDRNDIGLIRLVTPVDMTAAEADHVPRPVQVAGAGGFEPTAVYETGERFDTIGWGLDENGGGGTRYLHEADVPFMTSEACGDFFNDSIEDNEICAGGEARIGSCSGDSGSALLESWGNTQILIGVTSWGGIENCPAPGEPNVYAMTRDHAPWIMSTICTETPGLTCPTSSGVLHFRVDQTGLTGAFNLTRDGVGIGAAQGTFRLLDLFGRPLPSPVSGPFTLNSASQGNLDLDLPDWRRGLTHLVEFTVTSPESAAGPYYGTVVPRLDQHTFGAFSYAQPNGRPQLLLGLFDADGESAQNERFRYTLTSTTDGQTVASGVGFTGRTGIATLRTPALTPDQSYRLEASFDGSERDWVPPSTFSHTFTVQTFTPIVTYEYTTYTNGQGTSRITVTDPDGNPVPYATIEYVLQDGQEEIVSGRGRTDRDGVADLRLGTTGAGAFQLLVTVPADARSLRAPAAPPAFDVTLQGLIPMPTFGLISVNNGFGMIPLDLGASGQDTPIINANFEWRLLDGDGDQITQGRGRTDRDGESTLRIPRMAPGDYTLVFIVPENTRDLVEHREVVHTFTVTGVTPALTMADIAMQNGYGTSTITIRNLETNAVLPFARYSYTLYDGSGQPVETGRGSTNRDGESTLRLRNLAPGQFNLVFEIQEDTRNLILAQTVTVALDIVGTTPNAVFSGLTVTNGMGSGTITVTDEDGSPLVGSRFTWRLVQDGETVQERSGRTGRDGTYLLRIPNMAPGTYSFQVAISADARNLVHARSYSWTIELDGITPQAAFDGFTVQNGRGTGTLQITSESGTPLAASFTWSLVRGGQTVYESRGRTLADGTSTLRAPTMAPGDYTLWVNVQGNARSLIEARNGLFYEFSIAGRDPAVTLVDWDVTRGMFTATVRATDGDGNVLSGIGIDWLFENDDVVVLGSGTTRTGRDGTATIRQTNIGPDDYRLSVQVDADARNLLNEMPWSSFPWIEVAGVTPTVTFDGFSYSNGMGRSTVTVTDPDGQPLSGVSLEWNLWTRLDALREQGTARTGRDGSATIMMRDIGPGSWDLEVDTLPDVRQMLRASQDNEQPIELAAYQPTLTFTDVTVQNGMGTTTMTAQDGNAQIAGGVRYTWTLYRDGEQVQTGRGVTTRDGTSDLRFMRVAPGAHTLVVEVQADARSLVDAVTRQYTFTLAGTQPAVEFDGIAYANGLGTATIAVVDEEGDPLASVQIEYELYDRSTGELVESGRGRTGRDGHADLRLRQVGAGEWRLIVDTAADSRQMLLAAQDQTWDFSLATYTPTLTYTNVRVENGQGLVTITATDPNGSPVPRWRFEWRAFTGAQEDAGRGRGFTGLDGTYEVRIRNPQIQAYDIVVNADANPRSLVDAVDADTGNIAFEERTPTMLFDSGEVRGTWVFITLHMEDQNGVAMSGERFDWRVTDSDGADVTTGRTATTRDGDGQVRLRNLEDGDYQIWVDVLANSRSMNPGAEDLQIWFTLDGGQVTPFQLA